MGKASRDKGSRGEGEIVKLLPGARRLSAPYRTGPDGIWRNLFYEVKRRKDGWKQLYGWLDDDSSLLFLRADRKDWLVVTSLSDFVALTVPGSGNCTCTDDVAPSVGQDSRVTGEDAPRRDETTCGGSGHRG